MKRTLFVFLACFVCLCIGSPAAARTGFHDLQVPSALDVTTVTGVKLPSFFGAPDQHYAIFKIWPVVHGKRYEATLTFDAGTDIGYATSWGRRRPLGKGFLVLCRNRHGNGNKGPERKRRKIPVLHRPREHVERPLRPGPLPQALEHPLRRDRQSFRSHQSIPGQMDILLCQGFRCRQECPLPPQKGRCHDGGSGSRFWIPVPNSRTLLVPDQHHERHSQNRPVLGKPGGCVVECRGDGRRRDHGCGVQGRGNPVHTDRRLPVRPDTGNHPELHREHPVGQRHRGRLLRQRSTLNDSPLAGAKIDESLSSACFYSAGFSSSSLSFSSSIRSLSQPDGRGPLVLSMVSSLTNRPFSKDRTRSLSYTEPYPMWT